MSVSQLVAGALTLAMHLLLTRTAIGSQLLAVAEGRDAAMPHGHPSRPHAGAGLGALGGERRIAGALMAISFSFPPEVGGTFALTAFVVVTLGGSGSVPGALLAG